MKLYELNYLIPELSEEELKSLQEKINSLIQKKEGTIVETKSPTKKRLGYSIKGKETADLISLNFYFNPKKLEVLEKELKDLKTILRFQILIKKISKAKEKPSRIKPRIKTVTKIEKPKKVELEKIEEKLEELLEE